MSTDPMNMFTLARDNKAKEITAAIKLGIPADICNQMGQTAIHIGSLWGNVEAVKALLEGGANASVENARGQTPLHFAASARENGMEEEDVRMLLGGPDSRLFTFCEEGQATELKALLEGDSIKSVRVVDSDGRTPINLAVVAESLEIVQLLLTHDPECLSLADSAGDTPVLVAAMTGNAELLTYILSLKPKIDAQNVNQSEYAAGNWMLRGEVIMPLDKTPLHVAIECGEPGSAKLLLEAVLHLAVENLDEEMTEVLLKAGADPNAKCADMVSSVHYLSQRGAVTMIELLLDNEAGVTCANYDGWSGARHHDEAAFGQWSGCNLRQRRWLDPIASSFTRRERRQDAQNSQGSTPLLLAAVNGHAAVCQALVEAGADKSIANMLGKTAADLAKTP
eukprot:gene7479-624_t